MHVGLQPNPRIQQILAQVNEGVDDHIVSSFNQIRTLGIQDKLLYKRKVRISSVGVHRANRDGSMISGQESMKILDEVCSVGVDLDLLKDAMSFEEPPSRVNEKAFMQKCANDPRLPSCIEPGQIEVSSVACSHFNQALHSADEGKPHDNEEICIDGHLSKAKIIAKHPLLGPIFEEGMDWWVWKADAETMYPSLPDVAQRALNAKFSVQQGQDCFQVYGRAVALLGNSPIADNVSYAIRDIMKANPKCSNDVPNIVAAARKYGGTLSSGFVDQLLDFCSAFKIPGRTVPGLVWKVMAEMKFAADDLCPHFMTSVLMAIAASPRDFVSSGDIRGLADPKRLPEMKMCEDLIKKCLDMCNTMQVPISEKTKHIGRMRTSFVFKVMGKMKDLEKKSFENIAAEWFESVVVSATSKVANPWPIGVSAPVASAATSVSKKPDIIEYNTDGKAIGIHRAMILKKGFETGTLVKHKDSGYLFENQKPMHFNSTLALKNKSLVVYIRSVVK